MKLLASDRNTLIRFASSLPAGSDERRAILSGLKKVADPTNDVFWTQFSQIERVSENCASAIAEILELRYKQVKPVLLPGNNIDSALENIRWYRGTANRAKKEWVRLIKNLEKNGSDTWWQGKPTAPLYDWVKDAKPLLALCKSSASWRAGVGDRVTPMYDGMLIEKTNRRFLKLYSLVRSQTISQFPETSKSLVDIP